MPAYLQHSCQGLANQNSCTARLGSINSYIYINSNKPCPTALQLLHTLQHAGSICLAYYVVALPTLAVGWWLAGCQMASVQKLVQHLHRAVWLKPHRYVADMCAAYNNTDACPPPSPPRMLGVSATASLKVADLAPSCTGLPFHCSCRAKNHCTALPALIAPHAILQALTQCPHVECESSRRVRLGQEQWVCLLAPPCCRCSLEA